MFSICLGIRVENEHFQVTFHTIKNNLTCQLSPVTPCSLNYWNWCSSWGEEMLLLSEKLLHSDHWGNSICYWSSSFRKYWFSTTEKQLHRPACIQPVVYFQVPAQTCILPFHQGTLGFNAFHPHSNPMKHVRPRDSNLTQFIYWASYLKWEFESRSP